MNNKHKILIIIGIIVIIGISFIVGLLIGQKNTIPTSISPAPLKENEIKTTDTEFVRTYNIVSNLNMTDATGEYNFYVIQQFQLFEPIVIKVDNKYVLEENKNYEFTFKGSKIDDKDYTIQDIFNIFDITNIERTDKLGLEQRQDKI